MRKSEKQGRDAVLKFSEHKRKRDDELENEVDALFTLPLAEFTGARNALAARLKKSGRGDEKAEADRVKSLTKPSISAWAVNQLYWNHREDFDQLVALGERFHKAQTSRAGGKVADMRAAIDARRESLTHLTDLATSLLQDDGHNPSPDTIRRITTTLEGISAYVQRSDGRHPEGAGRLTNDVDPPGFESLAGDGGKQSAVGSRQTADSRRETADGGRQSADGRKQTAGGGKPVHQHEAARKAKIAAAKVSLQEAKRLLTKARARAQSLGAAQKKADAEAKKAEKDRRDAEERLDKAKAASQDAARRARNVAVEIEAAASAVEDAERSVENASEELKSLFG